MSQLLHAHESYLSQIAVEVKDEEERAARDAVKREQDLAFEMAQHVSFYPYFLASPRFLWISTLRISG